MRSEPELAYIVWIMVSTGSLLQALASYYGWGGLSFFRGRPNLGYLCAAIGIPLSYVSFFSLANRNTPGLEGWQLFSRFALSAGLAVALTLVVSSLLNRGMAQRSHSGHGPAADAGLDHLRISSYGCLLHDAAVNWLRRGES